MSFWAVIGCDTPNVLSRAPFPIQHIVIATSLDSFTVFLHSPKIENLPAVRAVQGTVSGAWKTVENPVGRFSLHCIVAYTEWTPVYLSTNHTFLLNQTSEDHVSYPNDSPTCTATCLGPCNSLGLLLRRNRLSLSSRNPLYWPIAVTWYTLLTIVEISFLFRYKLEFFCGAYKFS